jgi:hypothetical protein
MFNKYFEYNPISFSIVENEEGPVENILWPFLIY